ncbi:MAG: sigma-70 family RNA polymerase sigma factor [Deltaproteobacteria bacterium]|jgi:RNA polymerase sigma-70 factor (ECF subfamily)|nr:sigma-70 family RNA polymerase sigma factor [Deltaproteobacteria bacterium]MBW2535352.1 sigma-70 family RNA polymerase sigma factor [Deltaproteobacteria bacterium]
MLAQDPNQQDLSDLEDAARGRREAFTRVVERHQDAVFRLARALTPSEQEAEDVLQETFLSAYRHADAFRGEAAVRTWLLTIARRAAARQSRRRAGEPRDHAPLSELGVAAGWGAESDPEQQASDAERRRALDKALAALAPTDRAVIVLRDLEGMTGPAAAEVLGLTLPAVKTRLHRARLRLMAELHHGGTHGA